MHNKIKNIFIILMFFIVFLAICKYALTQPYLVSDPAFGVTSYKILTENMDMIDSNITVDAELDGSLKFNLKDIDENKKFEMHIMGCDCGFCSCPINVFLTKRKIEIKTIQIFDDPNECGISYILEITN
jgi:hypothetical protein